MEFIYVFVFHKRNKSFLSSDKKNNIWAKPNPNSSYISCISGDMNAKVGNLVSGLERVMGRHGMGTVNDNRERLIEFCDFKEMVITGAIFPHKEIHRQTWVSPDGRTKNQIDHILANRKFKTSVIDTRVMRSADVANDH